MIFSDTFADMKNIIIPENIKPYPSEYEISAAIILAQYFQDNITFIKRSQNSKSADFKILNKIWEIKSPIGNGKRTIQNNLRKANRQSSNIILDLRRCKLHQIQAINKIKFELNNANSIKQLIVILKDDKIIKIK